jgi:glycosyltransferase involved in cell wall biosynthesis
MRISILTANASSNAMGRAYILARVLQRSHQVEVIGPRFSGEIWRPVADAPFEIKSLAVAGGSRGLFQLSRLRALITGDLIYASKPLFASYGVALAERRSSGRPVLLDIDDWERGFALQAMATLGPLRRLRYLASSTLKPHMNHSWWNSLACDRLARRADAITSSNSYLQRRYGGMLVRHGRDTASFRPERFDRAAMRAKHGFKPDLPVVMFFGTIQPYKGLEDLVAAMKLLQHREALLALVGVTDDLHGQRTIALAERLLQGRLRLFGLQPFSAVPEFLALADVVVVPQRQTHATVGQMPAKLYDAMAMAKPVVATAVSDIPEALEGCGWIVPPGSPPALARAIDEALGDAVEAKRRGVLARAKCEREFSWDAMERALGALLEPFAGTARQGP